MYKIIRLLGILFVFSLLSLPLTGCDTEGSFLLVLKVDAPKNDTTVTTSTVTVNGHVGGTQSEKAQVTINDAVVPLKDRKFSTNVTLTEGKNVINIVASGGSEKMTETVTVTYAPAK